MFVSDLRCTLVNDYKIIDCSGACITTLYFGHNDIAIVTDGVKIISFSVEENWQKSEESLH